MPSSSAYIHLASFIYKEHIRHKCKLSGYSLTNLHINTLTIKVCHPVTTKVSIEYMTSIVKLWGQSLMDKVKIKIFFLWYNQKEYFPDS